MCQVGAALQFPGMVGEFGQQAANNFSNFLDLKESLEALFRRSVDFVELRAIRNRRLRYYIEQSKSSIYAAA